MTIKCGKGSLFTMAFAAGVFFGYVLYRNSCKKTAEVRAARADKARWENEGGPAPPPSDA